MRQLIIFCLLFLVVDAFAEQSQNVLHKTYEVSKINISSPRLLELWTSFNNTTRLSRLKFIVTGVQFSGDEFIDCTDHGNVNNSCSRLTALFKGAKLQVNLKTYDASTQSFGGDLFINGRNMIHIMIEEGWYLFDHSIGRSKYLILLQKQSMCLGKGIWSIRHSNKTKLECN